MKTLLVRAEDKNIWERRTPLVPEDLQEILAKTRAASFVQKSDIRFFPDQQYTAVGARLCDDMSPGDVILGIKEIPEHKLLDNKIYLFFSHTIKGQPANMPMLKKIITGGSTLIEYEKIADDQQRRLIYFGNYAGDAGAIDILWLMGQYWQHRGISTPFSQCKQALNYASVNEARRHLTEIGALIKNYGLPDEITPLVIGILGYGNVSKGAQQIFDCLPVERINPENLPLLVKNRQGNSNTVYLTIFKEEHLVKNKIDKPFQLQDYYQHPENYLSQFDRYLPFITILVNAVYWDSRYPCFVTWDGLKKLFESQKQPKLNGIADITCDIGGSIECNVKSTDSGMPAYLCDPLTRTVVDGFQGSGIVLLAVDNLPAELARDASIFFSRSLKPIVPNILNADFSAPLAESGLAPEVQKAVIVNQGKLTPSYEYLNQHIS